MNYCRYCTSLSEWLRGVTVPKKIPEAARDGRVPRFLLMYHKAQT